MRFAMEQMNDRGFSTNNLSNMTDLIRLKEKELHHIQDIRNSQLEATLAEKDKKIQDIKQKFEMLKDDFQYNLQLIEARDNEIERLDQVVKVQAKKSEELEHKIKSLNNKIDHLQLKEAERNEKLEQDKLMHKRVLDELKSVIESMQWSADEEIKTKAYEIEKLKTEIASLQRLKEEALEAQRRDLTCTFEGIIQKREEGYKEKEMEIASQIHALDTRFEKLHSENTRLKSDYREMKLMNSKLVEEMAGKDAQLYVLRNEVEDANRAREMVEDSLKRQVHSLQVELKASTEARVKLQSDLETQLEKMEKECLREREFRGVVEQRLAAQQTSSTADLSTLQDQLYFAQSKLSTLMQENDSLCMERDQLLQRLGSKRVEIDALSSQKDVMGRENATLQQKLLRLENDLRDVKEQYESLQKEYIEYRVQAEKRCDALQTEQQEKREQEQKLTNESILLLEEQHRETMRRVRERMDEDLKTAEQKYVLQAEELEKKHSADLLKKEEDIAYFTNQLLSVQKVLTEEKTEADALRLRLKDKEGQILGLQKELRSLRSDNTTSHTATMQSNNNRNTVQFSTGELSLGDMNLPDLPSPMMSLPDDLHMSWLNSPIPAPGGAGKPPLKQSSTPQKSNEVNVQPRAETLEVLVNENEHLKDMIREMRKDLEQLKTKSPSPPSEPPFPPKPPAESEQVYQLLEQRNAEILRLRGERKKLMDMGNELRAALLRQEQRDGEEYGERVEEARGRNLQEIWQWIEQPGEKEEGRRYSSKQSPQQGSGRNVWDYAVERRGGTRSGGGKSSEGGESSEESKVPKGGELGHIGGSIGMEVAGRGLGSTQTRSSALGASRSGRAFKSQGEALQRLKEQGRGRGAGQQGGGRRVRNYALGEGGDPSYA